MSIKDVLFDMHSWNDIFTKFLHEAFWFGLRIVACIILYLIGRKLIKILRRVTDKMMRTKEFDPSFASFIRSLINIILMSILIYIIIGVLGITTTSFVALFASIGVALGMAMSGTLQNFAGGVMILLFRPFRIGDYIEAQGQGGTVKEIQIFNTVIVTTDHRTVYIPNGGLSSNVIVNYNNQTNRRIEWIFGVAYGTSIEPVRQIIREVLQADARILAEPAPEIVVKTLNDSSVDMQVRAWVARSDYWDVLYAINEQVYSHFTRRGIDIPFPQLTVHLADKDS
jgi:small conductance mechanosensitive channel